jgi:twitching motility protein PilT
MTRRIGDLDEELESFVRSMSEESKPARMNRGRDLPPEFASERLPTGSLVFVHTPDLPDTAILGLTVSEGRPEPAKTASSEVRSARVDVVGDLRVDRRPAVPLDPSGLKIEPRPARRSEPPPELDLELDPGPPHELEPAHGFEIERAPARRFEPRPAPEVEQRPLEAPARAPQPSSRETSGASLGSSPIDRFLKLMRDRGASDLHMSVGRAPFFRISSSLEPIRYRVLTDPDFARLVEPITPPELWKQYTEHGDVDFAYEVKDVARFRVNLFRQERGMAATFRIIPTKLMTIEQLGLPGSIRKITSLRSGLVLVTGPTGSGKSTTLSAIIHEMNGSRPLHMLTIEDPIEFVHSNRRSLIAQREVGQHTRRFAPALRAALREDPDVIVVGELRDLETIEMAVTASGTGLIVFGTLHTNSAAKAVDRLISVFPTERQAGVRGNLAAGLCAVVAQQLLPRKQGGRVAAIEVMFANPALASMIRDGKTHQINGIIQTGKAAGMIAMDDSLKQLVDGDLVEPLHALEKALDKDAFRKWMKDRGHEVPPDIGRA